MQLLTRLLTVMTTLMWNKEKVTTDSKEAQNYFEPRKIVPNVSLLLVC